MILILEKQKKFEKFHDASMQKFFKDHLDQAICYLASFKACTSKTKLRRFFSKPQND